VSNSGLCLGPQRRLEAEGRLPIGEGLLVEGELLLEAVKAEEDLEGVPRKEGVPEDEVDLEAVDILFNKFLYM
jgi:hypothetical protein